MADHLSDSCGYVASRHEDRQCSPAVIPANSRVDVQLGQQCTQLTSRRAITSSVAKLIRTPDRCGKLRD
jgi:hypothetical protein